MVVSDLEGPERFWFQFYGNTFSDRDHYNALQSLMKELDEFYKSDKGDKYKVKTIMEVKLGTALAAPFQGVFHRVVLQSVVEPHNCKVRLEYIDYGTKDFQ